MKALHDKDLELFKQVVEPEYSFKGKDFDQVIGQVQGYFRDYDSIELSLDRPRIHFHGGRADCVEGYRMRVEQKGRPLEFNDTEKLEDAQDAGRLEDLQGPVVGRVALNLKFQISNRRPVNVSHETITVCP